MTERTALFCDGPINRYDEREGGCPVNVRIPVVRSHGRHDWITVKWNERYLHFCSWDCLLAFGAKQFQIEGRSVGCRASENIGVWT